MRIDKRLALLLVGLFLVLYGIASFGLPLGILVPLVALIAGIAVLVTNW